MLRPDSQWRWYFDQQQACLAMQLSDEMVFLSAYGAKQLGRQPMAFEDFDLEDHQNYSQAAFLLDDEVQFTAAFKTQAALNACALLRFHKPLMPKSWFFQRGMAGSGVGVATLTSNLHAAQVLVLQEGESCLCMLLDESLPLDEGKSLKQFEAIKVMRDCLQGAVQTTEFRRRA
ncbi:cell division protein ZapC [Aliiglaciecola sp. CAU 1673]|uniref:cell division protein ZapC domain-containing protein n=1 Tax=Aliiglaciecola sp. CAU 1673 TaxID=3032595 RepID=UPI0023DCEA11|nr:cell division protein ZapC domain-containing protein [Aliiglaciecola sp. CAU 1673]MDF2177525.1 cell division protein ZapC [Aliiglaciecola sp. CAU 1673]